MMKKTKCILGGLVILCFALSVQQSHAQQKVETLYCFCDLTVMQPPSGSHGGYTYFTEVFKTQTSDELAIFHQYESWVRSFDKNMTPGRVGVSGSCEVYGHSNGGEESAQSHQKYWIDLKRKGVADHPDVANREGNGFGYQIVQWLPGQTEPPPNFPGRQ